MSWRVEYQDHLQRYFRQCQEQSFLRVTYLRDGSFVSRESGGGQLLSAVLVCDFLDHSRQPSLIHCDLHFRFESTFHHFFSRRNFLHFVKKLATSVVCIL